MKLNIIKAILLIFILSTENIISLNNKVILFNKKVGKKIKIASKSRTKGRISDFINGFVNNALDKKDDCWKKFKENYDQITELKDNSMDEFIDTIIDYAKEIGSELNIYVQNCPKINEPDKEKESITKKLIENKKDHENIEERINYIKNYFQNYYSKSDSGYLQCIIKGYSLDDTYGCNIATQYKISYSQGFKEDHAELWIENFQKFATWALYEARKYCPNPIEEIGSYEYVENLLANYSKIEKPERKITNALSKYESLDDQKKLKVKEGIWTKIVKHFKNIWDKIKSFGKKLYSGLKEYFKCIIKNKFVENWQSKTDVNSNVKSSVQDVVVNVENIIEGALVFAENLFPILKTITLIYRLIKSLYNLYEICKEFYDAFKISNVSKRYHAYGSATFNLLNLLIYLFVGIKIVGRRKRSNSIVSNKFK